MIDPKPFKPPSYRILTLAISADVFVLSGTQSQEKRLNCLKTNDCPLPSFRGAEAKRATKGLTARRLSVFSALIAATVHFPFQHRIFSASPGGGIGRRAGFRCQWPLWSWKFESSPGHHTYTVFKAMFRISLVMQHVKCMTLVYPVVYPHAYHMKESLMAHTDSYRGIFNAQQDVHLNCLTQAV